MIDVNPNHLETVTRILARHVPECEVRAFGSRVTWTAKDYSDLDLAVVGARALNLDVFRRLKEAFEESDLPFRVDVVDWYAISPAFQKVIQKKYEVVQKGKQNSSGMADEWVRTRLGDIVSIKHGWPFKSDLFSGERKGKPVVIGIGNFRYTGGFRFEETIVKEYLGEYPREYELSPGDILLIMTCQTAGGEILGIPARVPDDGCVYLHNQRLGKAVITCQDKIGPNYLYWLFLWPTFNRELFLSASGTKILHTAPSRIEDFHFDLPLLPEQRAIAHILGTLDDKIELNRRMNATLAAMARALFKSWFVDFDPVRAKMEGRDPGLPKEIADLFPDRFEDSELGEIPEGWEVKSLDQIARFLNGLALQKYPPVGDRSLPVIKIAQLRSGNTTGADLARADLEADYIVKDGDILFSWSGSLECVLWAGGEGALNQHLFKVTSITYPPWLCYFEIHQHLDDFRHIAAGKATTMGHIQRHHLSDSKLAIPGGPLLDAMTDLVEPMFESLWKRNIESRTLAALRDALLPKLISGELRVPFQANVAAKGPRHEKDQQT